MSKKNIMIVDDDDEDRLLFCEVIESLDPDLKCIQAIHGMDALRRLYANEEYPDYIFLDLEMPRMDGQGCLTEIKKSIRLRHIPVIIYSVFKEKLDPDEMRNLGAAYVLTKPSTFTALSEAIKNIFIQHPVRESTYDSVLIPL